MTTDTLRRPDNPNGASVAPKQLTSSLADADHPGTVLFAARWSVFEPIALQLMEDAQTEQLDRASRMYLKWSERAAELNRPEAAKRDHSISVALAQKAELIRRYPGEMTDIAACLSDIFAEQVAVL